MLEKYSISYISNNSNSLPLASHGLCQEYAIMLIDLMTISFPSSDKFRADLMNIAMTTLSSKILSQDKEYFAELAVDAVLRLKVYRWFSGKLVIIYIKL